MEKAQRIADGVFVEQRLDGLSLRVQGVSTEQVTNLGFYLFFSLVPLLGASMFGLTSLVARSDSPDAFLAVGVAGILCVMAGRWLSHHLAGTLGRLYWQTFTLQGNNLTVKSLLSERRIPLADILAFDNDNCLLVTDRYRVILLAPRQPLRVRRALSGLIGEVLTASRSGSREDIPDPLTRLTSGVG